MISFKGAQFPREVILFAVFFYVRYTVSYRDLEEIMAERGVSVDHATLNRWVARYSPLIANTARRRMAPVDRSWRMDETYIKVKGAWVYLYRAVDKLGKTVDFMLSKRRNKSAATKFFARALEVNDLPRKIVIDRSGANTAGISAINRMLKSFGCRIPIEMVRIKYLVLSDQCEPVSVYRNWLMSGCTELTPLGESSGTVGLEILPAVEGAFLIEMVEDRGVDGSELL